MTPKESPTTRILERNGYFYPQHWHWLWGWMNYTEPYVCNDGLQMKNSVCFPTIELAQRFFMHEKTTIHPTTATHDT